MLRTATPKQRKIATILAFLSVPISGFVTDIYLPSFPDMAKSLSISQAQVQLTLTCYLLSYGISQLFIGGVIDAIGRYKPRLVALAVLVLTNLAITYTQDIWIICFMRIIQGLAIATLVVAVRAIFLDLYDTQKSKHYLSYFTIVWSCGPILAPFLGGLLQSFWGWQANFYFLAIYAVLLLLGEILYSGESIQEKQKFDLKQQLSTYAMMLNNKQFMAGIYILGFAYAVAMLFNISGPFIISNTLGFDAVTIGICTLILGIGWMLGGVAAKLAINKPFNLRIRLPNTLQIVLSLTLLVLSFYYQSLLLLILCTLFIHACSSVLFTSFFTTTMLYYPKNAATAGGLMGGLVYIITSLSTLVISSIGSIDTITQISYRYIVLCAILALLVNWLIFLKSKQRIN